MIIERTMNLLDVIMDSGSLTEFQLLELKSKRPDLRRVEYNITAKVVDWPTAAFVSGDPDLCYPAEDGGFEHDMTPEDVASMFLKQIVAELPESSVLPTILDCIWIEICNLEKKWQDENLAAHVWEGLA